MPTPSKPPAASDTEVAWLAGLLEGEGSFLMARCRAGDEWDKQRDHGYRYPKIVVGMTDEDVINRVAAMFGTSVYKLPRQPQRKQAWRSQIMGAQAAIWMKLLYPWLGERRRAKIDEILAEYDMRAPGDQLRREACSRAAGQRCRRGGRFVKAS